MGDNHHRSFAPRSSWRFVRVRCVLLSGVLNRHSRHRADSLGRLSGRAHNGKAELASCGIETDTQSQQAYL
jgi:hypothetical protein